MKHLIVGYNPEDNSTFSRITKHVLETLSNDNVYLLANNAFGRKSEKSITIPLFDLPRQFEEAIESFQPDIVISIDNLNNLNTIYNYRKLMSYSWKWISILNVENRPVNTESIKTLMNMDYVLTFDQFSYSAALTFGNASYARLGIDENTFFPLLNQEEIKANTQDLFSIVSPGSNSPNNYKIALLEAFTLFAMEKEDVFLYFCDRDNSNFYNLEDLRWRYHSIRHKTLLKNHNEIDSKTRDHDLNSLYNIADVCINTSTDNGFHLSVLESLKCGCEVILPQSPEAEKNYPKSSLKNMHFIDSDRILEKSGNYGNYIKIKGLADKLDELYIRHKRNKLNCVKNQNSQDFGWQEFNKELEYIFNNIKNIKNKEIVSLRI